jgi:hypothetical protein
LDIEKQQTEKLESVVDLDTVALLDSQLLQSDTTMILSLEEELLWVIAKLTVARASSMLSMDRLLGMPTTDSKEVQISLSTLRGWGIGSKEMEPIPTNRSH